MRLGIFGGTFNPIHLGHLLLAETARQTLSLDRIVFIPTGMPPHKQVKALPPGEMRLAMVRLAIRENEAFVASDIELQRKGPSFSLETVRSLHGQLPTAKLFLLIGGDMLTVRWMGWSKLKQLCTIVVFERPRARQGWRKTGIKRIVMPQVDISSSTIRERVRVGKSIRYLVPETVERYIREHGLYRARSA